MSTDTTNPRANPRDNAMAHYYRREAEDLKEKLNATPNHDIAQRTILIFAIAEAHHHRLKYLQRAMQEGTHDRVT
jgi:hypothetical protein